ncbi:MAG: DEAD/DEAH box helicase [Oligoflexia bacterium]|nr:DEAD/DEAH box helicase [Oligoflexia bacterium]
MKLSNIQAVSGLALLFERESVFQHQHLIVADLNSLDKLKAFLNFKKTGFFWWELPPFPPAKSPYLESAVYKRKRWQAMAQNSLQSGVFLASPQALLKKTSIRLSCFMLKKGESFNYDILSDYTHKEFVEREGEFSSRAFLIDIFSPVYDRPFRVELRGDHIQSIHLLDPTFKKRERELEQALISPIYEWSFKGEDRKKLCDHLRREENKLQAVLPAELFESFSRGKICFGFENLLNCLDQTCSLDFFSNLSQVWILDPEKTKEHFLNEQLKLQKEQVFFTSENLFLSWEKLEEKELALSKSDTHFCQSYYHSRESLPSWKQGGGNLQNALQNLNPAGIDLQNDLKKIVSFKRPKNIKKSLEELPVSTLVFVGSNLKELKKVLLKEEVISSVESDFLGGKSLIFVEKQLKESFVYIGDTAYLRAADFITQKKQNLNFFDSFRQRARALEFSKLEIGDLLVHRQHGVGEFMGLQSLKMKDKREDFITLCYKGGDKLFVPAYKAVEVKKYSRKSVGSLSQTLLDRLGNTHSWERKKSKAKKHIQSLAIELIELYKIRKQKNRQAFLPVASALENFEKDFIWTKTLDQNRAIQDIMSDMDKDYVMDRLLVGDTGFGKTEVALTAVFRVLENNFQVCFLAPTTVLTLQHFKNFKERFRNTPFKLALLNRFISKKEKENIFKGVKEGKIDFLISTHSVFSSQLFFKNLGLLVLDEEHRFGVRQKEQLFRYRKNLDVLSLSATPIPRTLNMALTGIKDISVISQAPEKRKPVKIILKSWTGQIEQEIAQACKKEQTRKGQVLFIHNRVKSLYNRVEQIQELLPDFKIAVAYGKSKNLDKLMLDFFNKKYDLLVATNIIESGMDIPQANTLFIDRAHEMGLSQIYQLKGRVGRSQEQAFCYLLYPEKETLSPLAKERLELLEKYSALGSSFQLALHDLENRGAGSLFGSEQSGHIQSLGEELYFEILNEQLKNQTEIFVEPEIHLPFSTGIPSNYISDPRLRLLYYKNLSSAIDREDRLSIQNELLEEFGSFPIELKHLFFLLDIREFCKNKLIINFKAEKKSLTLTFHEKSLISSQKLINLLEKRKGQMLSDNSCKIPFQTGNIVKESQEILEQLV